MEEQLQDQELTGIKLDDFFQTEYINYSVYDNIRKIASVADGLKNASRKIVHTVLDKNINSFTKVSNLAPQIQAHTMYLHGSIEGTVVNLAKNYVGANNIPLLDGKGNFGSAFINDASATRYIEAKKATVLDRLFNSEDTVNLHHQAFEGVDIEPRFFIPIVPLLAINGSDGVSVGFAQKILPRRLENILEWVRAKNKGKAMPAPSPYYNGMSCTITPGLTPGQWVISGAFTRVNQTTYTIDALPVGYNLKQYQNVLDKLVDDKVIKSYDDLSDNDVFLFEVKTDREFSKHSDDKILDIFKLVKKVTENYTCIDENNKIVEYQSLEEILEAWYRLRIDYNDLRKKSTLAKLNKTLDFSQLKYDFIQAVIDNKLVINRREDKDIKQDFVSLFTETAEEHYDKLMTIPVKQFSKKEIDRLNRVIVDTKKQIKDLTATSLEKLLDDDLDNL